METPIRNPVRAVFCESYRLCTIEVPGTMSFVGEGGAA